ncbi:hypothetical protein C0J52_16171 [Blattella germanica]|nr:hypothetical protein C0J52_16171 [Blattella germanica]
MKCVLILCLVMVIGLMGRSDGARILGIVPVGAKSHSIVLLSLMKELANRGHQVTVISHFPQETPTENYTDIVLKTSMVQVFSQFGSKSLFENRHTIVYKFISFLWDAFGEMCNLTLQEEEVQKLIHSTEEQFDVIIMEAFFNECFLGFVHKFKVPLIHVCPFGGTIWMGDWFGNPNPYSYVPDPFLNLGDKMNFRERLSNTLMGSFWKLGRRYYHLPKQNSIMKKYFGHLEDLPYISDIEEKVSLLLVNNHFSLNYPKPLMPNIIQVGGMHIKPPKQLPKDLKQYLDDAKDGVIYFSMGSNLRSTQFPEVKRKAFLQAFSAMKQKILWKWEEDTMPGKPDNVPVVGIPVFGDQELNVARAVSSGFGILLSFENITEESVSWALNEIINNPKYRENAKRLSAIYRDQPLTPMEQATYWVEYVIRHKGAPHLRSAVLDLAWYQFLLLDVIAVLALSVVAIVFILFIIVRTLTRKVSKMRIFNRKLKVR